MNDSLSTLLLAVRSAWPIVRRALVSGQLLRPQCELTPPDPDVLCEYDVEIPMPEGFVLKANVFRSHRAARSNTPVPVVMCAHPYDNHLLPALGRTPLGGPPQQYRMIAQVGRPRFSTITSWESPDPNFWIPAGYAVVNLNLPGYGGSGGPPGIFSDAQAKSFYDAIEWVAKQPWCTGAVGLFGVSFLAITQYHVAACRHYGGPPPSLKCIAPWEGLSDMYREQTCPGGIEDQGFGPFWWITEVLPALTGSSADFVRCNGGTPYELLARHPLYDDFWRERAADLGNIDVPMLVCASFSDHGLHTTGSFRAFTKARSRHKWVYTHRTGKWDAFYSDEVQFLVRDFMDCFLKGDVSSGFLERAPVRLEVRSSRDVIHAVRAEQEWPLARTRFTKLFLEYGALVAQPGTTATTVEHPARRGRSVFTHRFDAETELTGPMKLRLWVEARGDRRDEYPDDMAIFVAVAKRDHGGRLVEFRGSVGNSHDMVTRGFCRVSRRELDAAESTEWQPVLAGTSHRPLQPGEKVAVEIELYASSTFFEAGESLELIVASEEIIPSPPYRKRVDTNRGIHAIHFGGPFDSYLLVPVIPGTPGIGSRVTGQGR